MTATVPDRQAAQYCATLAGNRGNPAKIAADLAPDPEQTSKKKGTRPLPGGGPIAKLRANLREVTVL